MKRWIKLVIKAEKATTRKKAQNGLKKWEKSQKSIRDRGGGKVTP